MHHRRSGIAWPDHKRFAKARAFATGRDCTLPMKSASPVGWTRLRNSISGVVHLGFDPQTKRGAAFARLSQSARLALWSVLRHRRRTGLAMIAVAFGVAALILAGAFVEWIFWATRQGAIQSGIGHIQVARNGFHEKGNADLDRFLLPADSPVLQALQSTPGVKTVAPRLSFSGLASHGDTTLSFLGEGVDPDREKNFTDVSIIISGQDLASSAPDGVIVGNGLAANLGITTGDRITLLANKPGGGINAVEAIVRGLFATVSKAYDDSAIRVPLPLAHQLLRVRGAHRWIIVLDKTEDTPRLLAQLRTRYAGGGLEFIPWYDLADFYKKTVRLLSKQMAVIEAIIGLVIVLTIGNSMMMGVMERKSETGTTMALGTRARAILFQFVAEGLLLGVLGGAIGILLGLGIAEVISMIGIPMPPPPGQARGFRAGMIVTTPLVGSAFAIAVGTGLIAALYPAWRASRTNIVDALRHNR
jgi:putative ABC transport system permease protein